MAEDIYLQIRLQLLTEKCKEVNQKLDDILEENDEE